MCVGVASVKKYISTKVDGEVVTLCLSKCNLCPFMSLDVKSKTAYCVKNSINTTLPKKFIKTIYSYMYMDGYHYSLMDIDLPTWCTLPEDFFECIKDKLYYTKVKDQIKCEVFEDSVSRQIINDNNIKYIKDTLVTDNSSFAKNMTTTKYEPPKPTNTCSVCGDDKEEVDRTKNMGMCDDCWKQYQFDDEKNNFAYINNFRLKRKAKFSSNNFKKIVSD